MSFQLVPKSVTLNDLERRNGVILRCFSEFGYLPGALRKSLRSLSHLLMSSCFLLLQKNALLYCHSQTDNAALLIMRLLYEYVSYTYSNSCLAY